MKKVLIGFLALMVVLLSGCPTGGVVDDTFDVLLLDAKFLPNSAGQIGPFGDFTRTDGTYGMLLIDTVERSNFAFTEGNYFEVDMNFVAPESIGASSYTLEYSSENDTFQVYTTDGSTPLVTPSNSTDNFSISPGGSYYYRLAITGGSFDGWHSNTVYAPYTAIETYWYGYSENANMTNSDPMVMVPFVGNTRQISMTAKNLSDDSEVSFTPTFQWYRLNPATYQQTEITGATGSSYATTAADCGYYLVVRGTGDESTVGGFQQILDSYGIKIENRSFAIDVSLSGFYLVLEHAVAGISKDDFVLYQDDWATQIPITSLTEVASHPGIYRINATIPEAQGEVFLECASDFWGITDYVFEDHPWVENLTVDL